MKKIDKEIRSFGEFARDRQNRKTAALIIIAVSLLVIISIARDARGSRAYIDAGNGRVKGIVVEDDGSSTVFPLKVEAEIDGEKVTRDATITIEAGKKGSGEDPGGKASSESVFDSELAELIQDLSGRKEKKILLPSVLPDGTGIIWKRGEDITWPLLILLIPILIFLLYADGERKKREIVRERTESVERELPAFNDQLLLLLGSGLIFRDAFRRIADGYRSRRKKSYFQQEMIRIEDETEEGVSDIVSVITRRSEAMGVSRFSRLAGVIRDNQLRGTDISGKLKTEGEMLWDLRKRNAEEKGRLAETRLTLPLAILLLVLVLVTAAPAMIQVQGG